MAHTRTLHIPADRLLTDHMLVFTQVAASGQVTTPTNGLYLFAYLIGQVGGHLSMEVKTPDGSTITETVPSDVLIEHWVKAIITDYEKTKEN